MRVCKNISLLCKTGDDHRWLHMITDVLYMVKYKVSSLAVIVDLFYCIYKKKEWSVSCIFAVLQLYCLDVSGQYHRFQRFQPQVPASQQSSLLDLPRLSNHTSATRERYLDHPEGANRSV